MTSSSFDVETREVSRHFGRRRALSKVSLTFQAGHITGLFGPNGAGKSTLLAILSTILRPSAGDIRYGGRTPAEWGDGLRGRIGVLGHDVFLYSDLTARENLEFFGRLYALDRVGALRDRVARALGQARLDERADDRVGEFSRGLRQRLALERALLHDPSVVLLDEPFTGLDDESAALLGGRLRAIRDAGSLIVLATHDFESAEGLVDRAIGVRGGKARELPEGASVRSRYQAAMREAWA
jgi:ABC-type multidrug transport system ATPase subunit